MFETQAKALARTLGDDSEDAVSLLTAQLLAAYDRGREDKMGELRAAIGAAFVDHE